LAEGMLYSDPELTQKELKHMVMEASWEEYLNQQHDNFRESTLNKISGRATFFIHK
jgi:hypothetical protein